MVRKANPWTFFSFLLAATFAAAPTPAQAVVLVPPQRADLINVTVTDSVEFDSGAGLYTYSYSIKNGNGAQQNVKTFTLTSGAPVSDVTSPAGWFFVAVNTGDRGYLAWAAEAVAFDANGNLAEPASTIQPGDTLSGFSFRTSAVPGSVTFYSQGWIPIPQVTVSEEELLDGGFDLTLLDFTQNSDTGTVDGPASQCGDGIDNDGDGNTDTADAGCRDILWPVEDPACENGVDDDSDLEIDFPDDAGCHHPYDMSESADCGDGIDNSFDGLVDFPDDPGCIDILDASEAPDCSDDFDNDRDGFTDHLADPECAGPTGATELPEPSLIFGLATGLAFLATVGRRRMRL